MILQTPLFPRHFAALIAFALAARCALAADTLHEQFKPLPLGEVTPRGWLLDQIRTDAINGYGPIMDKLSNRVDPAIFDSRNKTELVKPKNGAVWWNGETTGNWLDGLVRTAYYSGDASAKRRVDDLVAGILASQEPDGYLGMYPKTLRFEQPAKGSAELWTDACLYKGLLAYQELTGRKDVLEALERAMKLVMSQYGSDRQFWSARVGRGGPTHNLMFVDVCEWLWRKTGDKAYADFARFLYDTYNERKDVYEPGVQVQNLSDPAKPFKGHGAHVMEHLRVPLFVAYSSGDPRYRSAIDNILSKTDRHLNAGGACISDEDILERPGSPDIGCEYCTMLELLHSLESAMQKMGRPDIGDRMEVLAFNAAEGARQKDGRAIQYLTRDNQHAASADAGSGTRFKLSPTHDDVATCCPVNALKFFPYLVGGLWLKEKDDSGLVAAAYAPSVVRTKIAGADVTVESDTRYPFEDEVRMTVSVEKPVKFSVRLRVPQWAGSMDVTAPGAEVRGESDWRVVTKEWHSGDRITVTFKPEVARKTAKNGSGVYWQRGPLVYSLPIASERKSTRDYPVEGFADWDYKPAGAAFWDYAVNTETGNFVFAPEKPDPSANPWIKPPVALTGTLLNNKSGQAENVRLTPMGGSTLRHTVFPDANHAAPKPSTSEELLKSDANLARKAEVVTATTSKGYDRNALIDGVAEGHPKNRKAEWASDGGAGTKVKLVWEMPEQVACVWLYDRPNPKDQVIEAKIRFSDGSTVDVGELPNDGATPLKLTFPSKTITWMEVTITRTSMSTKSPGFSEIAVFEKDP